ncbi:hypothetical protein [Limnoglobus roseus]|uniref:hypothetical protein n=1 Tax=Limnoglobus roseus TaxID=2598579 RepID=UPI0011EB42CE|nr:hypothetical protein [Limnoglobus roseus]
MAEIKKLKEALASKKRLEEQPDSKARKRRKRKPKPGAILKGKAKKRHEQSREFVDDIAVDVKIRWRRKELRKHTAFDGVYPHDVESVLNDAILEAAEVYDRSWEERVRVSRDWEPGEWEKERKRRRRNFAWGVINLRIRDAIDDLPKQRRDNGRCFGRAKRERGDDLIVRLADAVVTGMTGDSDGRVESKSRGIENLRVGLPREEEMEAHPADPEAPPPPPPEVWWHGWLRSPREADDYSPLLSALDDTPEDRKYLVRIYQDGREQIEASGQTGRTATRSAASARHVKAIARVRVDLFGVLLEQFAKKGDRAELGDGVLWWAGDVIWRLGSRYRDGEQLDPLGLAVLWEWDRLSKRRTRRGRPFTPPAESNSQPARVTR